jgi:hypothetical protein
VVPDKAVEMPGNGSLSNTSADRLTCLMRHWTWADEAMARFERELADGLEYDEDLGALCGFFFVRDCCGFILASPARTASSSPGNRLPRDTA